MKKNLFVYIIVTIALVLMLIHVTRLNFYDLSWDANSTPYTGILIAISILIIGFTRLKSNNSK